MKSILRVAAGIFCLSLAGVLAAALPGSSGYKVLKTIPLGGEGGWDYLIVDGAARRVYISHAPHVVVLDADTGSGTGDIPDTARVHGIALASGTRARLHEQRPREYRHDLRSENAENPRNGRDRRKPRRDYL